MAGEVVPERLGRGTSFENGSVSASPLQAVSGGVSEIQFHDFFSPISKPFIFGGLVFDGFICLYRIGLQNFAWKRCGAPETPAGFKKQAWQNLESELEAVECWWFGATYVAERIKLWLWLFGVVKVVDVFPAFQVQNPIRSSPKVWRFELLQLRQGP